jgi:hypothetical protein
MQLLMVDGNGILHPRGLLYSFGIAISLINFLPVGVQLLCFCRLCFISYKKCFQVCCFLEFIVHCKTINCNGECSDNHYVKMLQSDMIF